MRSWNGIGDGNGDGTGNGRGARLRGSLVAASCALLAATAPLSAQAGRVATGVLGGVAGFAAGAYVSTSVVIAKARTGRYVYALEDMARPRWELLPIPLLTIAGIAAGAASPSTLGRSVGLGLVGFGGGALLGLGAGSLLGSTDEARWAGAILGSATGLLVGIAAGVAWDRRLADEDENGGAADRIRSGPPLFMVRVPWP